MFDDAGREQLFPVRYLGFGFFWAWLFLVTLSPSPLLGAASCLGGIPFEMGELLARTVLLVGALTAGRWLATRAGRRVLLIAALVCGIATVPLGLLGNPAVTTGAAVLAAVADTAMFLLWLSFFGYMRLGDTLALLVLSYGAGSVLYLVLLALDRTALVVAAALLPALSCGAFVMSAQLQGSRTGESLFEAQPPQPQSRIHRLAFGHLTAPLVRMTMGLGVFSLGFALFSGLSFATAASNPASSTPFAYLVEPVCIVFLAIVYLALARIGTRVSAPYVLYRVVPVLMGAGFAGTALGVLPLTAAGCIALAYVMFEVLAFNDYCNIVRAEQSSLLGTMALGRLATSAGMLCGWAVGYTLAPHWAAAGPQVVVGVVGLMLVVTVSTLVFTSREITLMHTVADDRALQEAPAPKLDRTQALESYARQAALSKREAEVMVFLVEGRTTSYIASKLLVAESTVRAHVHGIYRKSEVGSRMELLDAFKAYCGELEKGIEGR